MPENSKNAYSSDSDRKLSGVSSKPKTVWNLLDSLLEFGWRHGIAFSLGLTASVFTILWLGTNLDQYIADKIRDFRLERLSPTVAAFARAHSSVLVFDRAPSIEYGWLLQLYGRQLVLANDRFSYENQPFQITHIKYFDQQDGYHRDGIIIFWPRQCSPEGCRYDLAEFGSPTISATIYGVNIKSTNTFVNHYVVLIDASDKYFVFNGARYETISF